MAGSKIKKSWAGKLFYSVPGVSSAYHFLWAWGSGKLSPRTAGKIVVVGVTGTKGKTTTLELLNAMLEAAGKRTALLSSLRTKIAGESRKNNIGNSMPGRGYLQKFIHDAVRNNCAYALIEVTSQGVALHRHRFIDWNVGVITNLHPEHIESHGSFENYRNAKLDFLKYVMEKNGSVFLNRDDKHFKFFAEALLADEPIQYSKDDELLGDYLPKTGKSARPRGAAAPQFILSEVNTENIAAAAAVAKHFKVSDASIKKAVANFAGVPGRMQFVRSGRYTAVVDYAHTPESLEAAYRALRGGLGIGDWGLRGKTKEKKKLICVLGAAGGGRDRSQRPAMGKIAAKYCDEIILTDEDPYDEDPRQILSEIKSGALNARFPLSKLREILDRKEAIRKAVALMRPGDIVIATGKGSEDWIHVANGKKVPWNERGAFERVFKEKFPLKRLVK